ncbi:unnamed protein product [Orchesella dallaii]|uniref:Endonuclease/exonuclease/phosphatase domain-containing protein n=1 Tax=Orchesella dallaii TaxID=48710 RepID=A0ABP1QYX0_9HEXA
MFDVECLIVKITTVYLKPILICTIYIPPSNICDNSFQVIEDVFSFLRAQKNEFIVQGDFNVDLLTKNDESLKLFRLSKQFDLFQKIGEPTRIQVCRMKHSQNQLKKLQRCWITYTSPKVTISLILDV